MSLTIRDAQPADAAAIIAIFNPIIETGLYTAFETPFTVEAERAYIEGLTERDIFHVAIQEPDGPIVGFQSMSPYSTYTTAFDHVGVMGTFVDLNCRRQGIASRLFTATFAVAHQKGYEKISTFVRKDNPSALNTYLNQGFHIVGTAQRQAKIQGRYVDEIIIEKFLEVE